MKPYRYVMALVFIAAMLISIVSCSRSESTAPEPGDLYAGAPPQAPAPANYQGKRIIFLHHSCGSNLIDQGGVRERTNRPRVSVLRPRVQR